MVDVLFTVDPRHHGTGEILFAWDPEGTYVASAGSSRVVQVFDRRGELIDQIVPPSPSACTSLEWNWNGTTLAITQANSGKIVFWDVRTKSKRIYDAFVKDVIFIRWCSTAASMMAIGTGKGNIDIFDNESEKKINTIVNQKKKVLCSAWSNENIFAYACQDRQNLGMTLCVCDAEGEAIDQVKVYKCPLSISFGGKGSKESQTDRIVSVNLEGKAILLYDLDQRDNAVELVFQERYGDIISYRWCGNGSIIAGFSTGFVVAFSTHPNEIGNNQYCGRVGSGSLTSISYCAATDMIATCCGSTIKVVSMVDWNVLLEVATEEIDREAGLFDQVSWTRDGRTLSASSRTGCLYTFAVRLTDRRFVGKMDSITTYLIRPMSPLALILTMLAVSALMILVAVYHTNVSIVDLVRALCAFHPHV